jgi:hypothetical protein
MNARPRHAIDRKMLRKLLPDAPGVYALYRSGAPVYVGKAKALGSRVPNNHLSRGPSMANSALRRNVAETLGIVVDANDIKTGGYRPTVDDAQTVNTWIDGCEFAWRSCDSEADAVALETAMKSEWLPRLTKR